MHYYLALYVTKVLSVGTLLGHVGLIVFLFLFLFKKQPLIGKWWKVIASFFLDNAVLFSFLIPLAAVAASLFYSEVAQFAPCTLCWWQRVLIYPQAVIWAVALYRKKAEAVFYALPLTILGTVVAISHYAEQLEQMYGHSVFQLIPCSVGSPACSSFYFLEFGYITIPLMSLTSFVILLLIQWQLYRHQKRKAHQTA